MTDRLEKYRDIRDFSRTPEPQGGKAKDEALTFVVQKHAARRLHYDMRFQVDDVMPSWAVPKGPSYDPKIKRLAVHTEDHPLDYQTFEGIIPQGEYGGGRVIVWDRGTYERVSHHDKKPLDMRDSIDKGHFTVRLHGEKLNGEWTFIRTSWEEAQDAWVVVKNKDEFADPKKDIVEERPESVITGKTIDDLADPKSKTSRTRAKPATSKPKWIEPMLAKLAKTSPVGDSRIYERKLDGLRCIAIRNGDDVTLWSRNQLSFSKRFPMIIEALADVPADDFVFDGEIVAVDKKGRTDFSLLQGGGDAKIQYHIFDVIRLFGQSTVSLDLMQRKKLVAGAITENDVLRVPQMLDGDPDELLAKACQKQWEGLVAKRADSKYHSGRSSDWLKLKCTAGQELVIGGWTEPKGARSGFGALLMGYFEDGELRYAGKVGTGFNTDLLADLHKDLVKRERATSPFADLIKERDVHWARPELVANVGFTEWTNDGKLRHPRFEGLRVDKNAKDVAREKR